MIRRVIVANRGEIARRIYRACRELDIVPIAIYGDNEQSARHIQEADDAYRIDHQPGILPYLNVDAILNIARRADADAIHPGYGFLSENPALAAACAKQNVTFIGPPATAIKSMGDKVEARALAKKAGVPVVPGSVGPIRSTEEALAWGDANGFPIALKAAGGGGGRGFRVAHTRDGVEGAFDEAQGEAQRSFSNPSIYAERYIARPRHIEIQLFADQHGTIVSLGERECSIQRRHQKLIEETPSPAVDATLRQQMGDAAIALAREVGYQGAGTVEFLLDEEGGFYFLEMNTRIQVEHTITEMVTGIDLVKEQLLVAAGEPLSFLAEDVRPRGHAIECRVNAEDVPRDFAPAPGEISAYREPAGFGVRVDSAVEAGDEISPAYDSMIAKLVTWGRNRPEAIARMDRALADFSIEGVPTTIPFHVAVMRNEAFRAGETNTAFLAEHRDDLVAPPVPAPAPTGQPEREPDSPGEDLLVEVGGRRLEVRVHGLSARTTNGTGHRPPQAPKADRAQGGNVAHSNGGELLSPVQGTVVRVHVEPGQRVSQGDPIVSIEAMKMENAVPAHRSGSVVALDVKQGQSVRIGTRLATIEE